MKELGASEARNRLGQLLDRVETGEEVVITRRGKVVARMVPETPSDRERGQRAAARIRALRKEGALGGLSIKDLIGEGRM